MLDLSPRSSINYLQYCRRCCVDRAALVQVLPVPTLRLVLAASMVTALVLRQWLPPECTATIVSVTSMTMSDIPATFYLKSAIVKQEYPEHQSTLKDFSTRLYLEVFPGQLESF